MRKLVLIAAFVALVETPSNAAPVSTVQTVAEKFVIPRFRAVQEQAASQELAWNQFCKRPAPRGIADLQSHYNAVSNTWAQIEFIRIGPAAADGRVERFNYWLNRRDEAGHALANMLSSTDPKALELSTISAGTVASQGLPILERLLFGDDARKLIKGPAARKRCAIGITISRSLSSIASDILNDWTKANGGALEALKADKAWGTSFANAKEAASVMLTDLVGGIDVIRDFKLAMMVHDLTNPGAPQLAENARSGRSLKDIQLNFVAIQEALAMFAVDAAPPPKAQLESALATAAESLNQVAAAERGDKQARMAALQSAMTAFGNLKQTEMATLPAATGLALGFNNLDGD